METLRYGIVGTGMMGIEHINNLLHVEGAEITALCDPHGPSRDAAIALVPGADVFADHRELIAADHCDALVVASPNMTHIDILRDALRTELHILVEKPLCTTVADCREVVELDAARGAITWVGLEYRYIPAIARLVEEVDAGVVGRPRMVAIREHRFPFLSKVDNWNRFSRNTGGTLVEKCCHFFDLMARVMPGTPVRVMASGAQDVNHLDERYDGEVPDILDNAFVVVDFDDGSRGMLDLCMFAEATQDHEVVSVVGEAGKVEALVPSQEVRIGRRGEHFFGAVERHVVTDDRIAYEGHHAGSSYLEHLRFRDAVRGGGEPDVAVRDGLMAVAIGAAAHRSIDEGRPVLMAELTGS